MKSFTKYLILFICTVTLMVSCKDENSIQTYYVDHQEKPNFTTYDISAQFSDVTDMNLSEEDKATLNSLEKLNIIRYAIKDNNIEDYKKELETVKKVFKNEAYEELMEFSDSGIKFRINAIGEDDAVDEILLLASSQDKGFAVVRILGDDMDPQKMANLISKMQSSDVDTGQLKDIMSFLN